MTVEIEQKEPTLDEPVQASAGGRKVWKIHVHHSSGDDGSVDAFRTYHKSLGWADIGYHFVVGNGHGQELGLILPGRDISWTPASVAGHNTGAIAICTVGNYEEYGVPQKAWDACVAKVAELCKTYSIPVDRSGDTGVFGHKEQGNSDCPGKNWDMDKFRSEVKAKMNGANPTPSPFPYNRVLRLQKPYISGNDVLWVQQNINKVARRDGFPKGVAPVKEDGIYGPGTEKAVGFFQYRYIAGSRDNDPRVDGVVGSQTWTELRRQTNNL